MALVAHLATLKAHVPFLHFFDGFRTSHEVQKIDAMDPGSTTDLTKLVDCERHRSLPQPAPESRASPSAGHRAEPGYLLPEPRSWPTSITDATPDIVEEVMEQVGELTGRHYQPVRLRGRARCREASSSLMGSGCDAAEETIDYLTATRRKGRRGEGAPVPSLLR